MTNIFCIRPKGFNVGNEAIHVALRQQLAEAFGEPVNVINLPATSRYESSAKAGFTAATVHEMNQYADGVIVGGGNLYENGELDVDPHALACLDVPLMLYSLSMGRIYDRRGELVRRTDSMTDSMLATLHEHADISVARDEATVEHLAAAGCESRLGGCPTIGIDRVAPSISSANGLRPEALISIRTPDLMSVPLSRRIRVKADIERIVAQLQAENDWRFRLLCHDHRDIPFAASFGELDYLYTDDVGEYLAMLRGAELIIAYRLHAAIPCLAFGTPVIKVSYDERGNSAMKTIGMEEWNIDLLGAPDVAAAVVDRYRRLNELDAYREAARPAWERLLGEQADAMAEFARLVAANRERDVRVGDPVGTGE